MKRLFCAALLVGALSLSGCAFLDRHLGVGDGAPPEQLPPVVEKVVEGAGTAADRLVPGLGALVLSLLTGGAVLYRKTRKKKEA